MDEPILDHVKRRLEEHRRYWAQCSRDTGVDYSTVYRIGSGRSTNPELANIQKIIDWCNARDAMLDNLTRPAATA